MTPPPILQAVPGAGFLRIFGVILLLLSALWPLGTMLMSVVPTKLQTQAPLGTTFSPPRQAPVVQATKTQKPPKLGRLGAPPNASVAQPWGEFIVTAPVGRWSESVDVHSGHFWFDGAGQYRIQKGVDDGPIFESSLNANIGDAKTVRLIAVGNSPVHIRVSPVPLQHFDTVRMFPREYVSEPSREGSQVASSPAASVYKIGGPVSQPAIMRKIEPGYSEEARKAHLQGTVELVVIVDETGHVHDIKVEKSLGMGLDEKAVEAVGKWLFLPAKKNGEPVAVYATIDVTFHLL